MVILYSLRFMCISALEAKNKWKGDIPLCEESCQTLLIPPIKF